VSIRFNGQGGRADGDARRPGQCCIRSMPAAAAVATAAEQPSVMGKCKMQCKRFGGAALDQWANA